MKKRFLKLWQEIGAKGDVEEKFAQLYAFYSKSDRFYHNLFHVQNCMDELYSVDEAGEFPKTIEFAIWYHDIIYDTKAKDNEEKSAQIAYVVCLDSNLSEEFSQKTYDLILATKHDGLPNNIDEKLLIDIDLSILGKPDKEFDEYETNIRKEYSWVSELDFKDGRSSVLKMFLDRDSIYMTDFFRNKYEIKARINLEKALKKLS